MRPLAIVATLTLCFSASAAETTVPLSAPVPSADQALRSRATPKSISRA